MYASMPHRMDTGAYARWARELREGLDPGPPRGPLLKSSNQQPVTGMFPNVVDGPADAT